MTAPPLFTRQVGTSPLLVSIPHAGTYLPPEIAARLTDAGRAVPDTDWHVDRLYGFLADLGGQAGEELGEMSHPPQTPRRLLKRGPGDDGGFGGAGTAPPTFLIATHSRYVVDLNRAPDGRLLYPGQAETGICPTETFAGAPIYAAAPPTAAKIAARVAAYWQPYHDALRAEIARLHALHGVVHVLDGHSIHGTIPRLFAGDLPDLNVGTNDGASAGAALTARVMKAVYNQGFSHVLNGRFKGGAITRIYGAPAQGVHVVQLEMAWRAYLDEAAPAHYDPSRADKLIGVLRRVVLAMAGA